MIQTAIQVTALLCASLPDSLSIQTKRCLQIHNFCSYQAYKVRYCYLPTENEEQLFNEIKQECVDHFTKQAQIGNVVQGKWIPSCK